VSFRRLLIGAVTGAGLVIGLTIAASSFGRIATLSRATVRASVADQVSSVVRPAVAATASSDFVVEVVDANNRRWVLRNNGVDAPPAVSHTVPPKVEAAKADPLPDGRATDLQKNNRERWGIALQRPLLSKSGPAADIPAPALEAVIAPALAPIDPRAIAPSPELPMPATGANFRPPELLHRVEPVYSDFAKQAHLVGAVRINATIGKDGVPQVLALLGGDARLAQTALDAVRQWRYKPAQLN
jgi:Gram-negative bacterial TonB protein C-terminal